MKPNYYNIWRIFIVFHILLPFGTMAQNVPLLTSRLEGTLHNQLSYFIHPTKADKAYFYLVLKTGSANENEQQKGYAHFLEHIVFSGGKRLVKIPFLDYAKTRGWQIGRHINAETNYQYTVYKIQLENRPSTQDIQYIIHFFADILDGLEFNQYDIEREKKVIFQEMQSRKNDDLLFFSKLGSQSYLRNRKPIGDSASINTVTVERLKTFWKSHYHPNRAAVIVVGNILQEDIFYNIETQLGTLQDEIPLPVVEYSLYQDLDDKEEMYIPARETKTLINFTSQKLDNEQVNQALKELLYYRLKERLPSDKFLSVRYGFFLSDVWNLDILLDQLKELSEYRKVFEVIKELADFPISDAEYYYINTKLNDGIIFNNLSIEAQMVNLMDNFIYQNKLLPLEQPLPWTKKDLQRRAHSLLYNSKIRVFHEGSKPQFRVLSILDEIRNNKNIISYNYQYFNDKKSDTPTPTLVDLNTNKKIRSQQPKSQKYLKNLGVTKLIYPNGSEVYLKPLSSSEDTSIEVWAIAEGGLSAVADKDYHLLESMMYLSDIEGIGNLDAQQVARYAEQYGLSYNWSITDHYRMLSASASSEKFINIIKLLNAKMYHNRWNFHSAKRAYEEEQKQRTSTPNPIENKRYTLPWIKGIFIPIKDTTPDKLDYIDFNNIKNFYNATFGTAAEWRWIIVGNFKTTEILPLINQYIGGGWYKKPQKLKNRIRFSPKALPWVIDLTQQDKKESYAEVHQIFYGKYNHNEASPTLWLNLLEKVLQSEIQNKLRNQKGWVYSSYVTVEKQAFKNGHFTVDISYYIDKKYIKTAQKEIANLIHSGLENIDIENYKSSIINEYQSVMDSNKNHIWIDFLFTKIMQGETIESTDHYPEMIERIEHNNFIRFIKNSLEINKYRILIQDIE